MAQSFAYQDPSLALTADIFAAKARFNLSWRNLTRGTGLSLTYLTAALHGQHPCRSAPQS